MRARNSWTCIQIFLQLPYMFRQMEGKDKFLCNFFIKEQIVYYVIDNNTFVHSF